MKYHRFDPWSFVFGAIIVAVGLFFLTTADPIDLTRRLDATLDLGLPILALILGAALVVPALRRTSPEPPPLTQEERQAHDELNESTPPLG